MSELNDEQKDFMKLVLRETFLLMKTENFGEALDQVSFIGELYSNIACVFIVGILQHHKKHGCSDTEGNCEAMQTLKETLGHLLAEPAVALEKGVQQNMIMYGLELPGWEPIVKLDAHLIPRLQEMHKFWQEAKASHMDPALVSMELERLGGKSSIGTMDLFEGEYPDLDRSKLN